MWQSLGTRTDKDLQWTRLCLIDIKAQAEQVILRKSDTKVTYGAPRLKSIRKDLRKVLRK
jgi:hypothetical protein